MCDVLNANEIPNFSKIDEWFEGQTEWKIEIDSCGGFFLNYLQIKNFVHQHG
jgi:hypothetical protein